MKSTTLRAVKIKRPDGYAALDDRGVDNYYRSGERKNFLSQVVVDPFEYALKERTGYWDGNAPSGKKETSVPVGDIEFHVTTTPTAKRPPIEEVYQHARAFLGRVMEDYMQGRTREGVRTIEGMPYIDAAQVLNEIAGKREEVISEGIRQGIAFGLPRYLKDWDSFLVEIGCKFGLLKPEAAKTYVRSVQAVKMYGDTTKKFEANLKGLTGYTKDSPPEETADTWEEAGSHLFLVKTIPYKSVSYAGVINTLVGDGEKPEKMGEVRRASLGIVWGLDAYRPKTRDGSVFLELGVLQARLDGLVEENTETAIRQPILHFPLLD
ncbi:MAG: hypothetical protein HY518_01565 [Candidatus Aenigmarchaeota archaeon]|nr:hypothetical protein [Candidatus Aenigmarchaeota archaeon]